jgi:predicted dehydrogenase
MKTLIVGMGFGKAVYGNIYKKLGWDITYIDISHPDAHFKTISDAIEGNDDCYWDTCHITTPNHTHYELADTCALYSHIVFVEKPGVANAEQWTKLLDDHPDTRIMMVKNNQYRNKIIHTHVNKETSVVKIHWICADRVPNPGSWFTNTKLAFGGVSRDLMPHLLSIYQAINPQWKDSNITYSASQQFWTLDDLARSDYGTVDSNGIYDVDDFAILRYNQYELCTNWRSANEDDFALYIDDERIELGPLCPEIAYERMITSANKHYNDPTFWEIEREKDIWIHQQIQKL